ncbi:PIG-L deacetylase family protein [Sphingomonas rubra]|uniref:N-acetylglucosaminyl deacetylase, LmbE family n=1 Tax=Sphingomonas rubra TaxID=634430 RepID=A0A1I5PIT2_9SPHN|nr:PIG-L family deacetylase [Sphingomonas rubra]SFP33945.1 N-acetylglucosaminyl deacetylase, LmbE family [Sphingomonas rubra]
MIPLARSRHAAARWAVLAPHPDDETIGVGALIAQAAAAGRLARVVYLTDGSGSHPLPRAGDRARLVRCRAREAGLSVRRLAGRAAPSPLFLGWQDGHPPAPGSPAFTATARRLAILIERAAVDAIAVTAADETHGDHVAAHALVRAAAARARRRVAVFVYRVWGGAMPRGPRPPLVTVAMPPGRRRHALAAHRSQMTAALGPGFRVPPPLRRPPARDRLYPDTPR